MVRGHPGTCLAAKSLQSPAWVGVGHLAGAFWNQRKANHDWCWGCLEPTSGPQQWGLGDARTYFWGDRKVVAVGTMREVHAGPQARQSVPGEAGRAAEPTPSPRLLVRWLRPLARPEQPGGGRLGAGAGWEHGGPGGPEPRVALPLSPWSCWPPSSLFDASHHRLQTGCPLLPPPPAHN